jgi:hypothetical protein
MHPPVGDDIVRKYAAPGNTLEIAWGSANLAGL